MFFTSLLVDQSEVVYLTDQVGWLRTGYSLLFEQLQKLGSVGAVLRPVADIISNPFVNRRLGPTQGTTGASATSRGAPSRKGCRRRSLLCDRLGPHPHTVEHNAAMRLAATHLHEQALVTDQPPYRSGLVRRSYPGHQQVSHAVKVAHHAMLLRELRL